VLLGFFFNLIGLIILLLLGDRSKEQRAAEAERQAAAKRASTYRECPHCKEEMRRDAMTTAIQTPLLMSRRSS